MHSVISLKMALSVSTAIGLVVTLALFVPSVVPTCRNFVPTALDSDWFLTPRTWLTPYSDNIPQTEFLSIINPQTMTGSGSNSFCWRSTFKTAGAPMSQPLDVTCTYDKTPQRYICSKSEGAQSVLFSNWPSKLKVTIVMTDNSTYAVMACCMDGTQETWTIVSTMETDPPEAVMKDVEAMFTPRTDKTETAVTYRIGEKMKFSRCGIKDGDVTVENVRGGVGLDEVKGSLPATDR